MTFTFKNGTFSQLPLLSASACADVFHIIFFLYLNDMSSEDYHYSHQFVFIIISQTF